MREFDLNLTPEVKNSPFHFHKAYLPISNLSTQNKQNEED